MLLVVGGVVVGASVSATAVVIVVAVVVIIADVLVGWMLAFLVGSARTSLKEL